MLYIDNKSSGTSKLVLKDVGGLPYRRVLDEAVALFQTDVLALKVTRIDLAVDVNGFPVTWFRDHICVRNRRSRCEIGTLSYRTTVSREVETIYLGARPNLFRIYDKIAQLRAENHGAPLDKSWPKNAIVTRVERQYGGKRIPKQLATLGQVREQALRINPFEPIEFSPAGPGPIPVGLGGSAYLKVLGMRKLVADRGLQGAIAELNQRTGGKGRRLLRGIQGFSDNDQPMELPDLLTKYRQWLAAQFNDNTYQRGPQKITE